MAPATPALSDSTAPGTPGASGIVTSWVTCASACRREPGPLGADDEHGRAPQRGRGERHALRAPPGRTRAALGQRRDAGRRARTSGTQRQAEDGAHAGAHRLGAVQVGGAGGGGEGGGAEGHRRAQQRAHVAGVGDAVGVDDQEPAVARASAAGAASSERAARSGSGNTAMTSGGVSSVLILPATRSRDRVDGRRRRRRRPTGASRPRAAPPTAAPAARASRARARTPPAAGGRRRGRPRRGRRLPPGRRLHARGTCAAAATPPA